MALASWLLSAQEDFSCLAMIGVRGGVAIYPTALLRTKSDLAAALSRKPPEAAAAGSQVLDFVRYSATSWELTISVEPTRYIFYLPEDARTLGLVPQPGEVAIVFSSGDILEVWTPTDWIAYLRRMGESIARIERAVLDKLHADDSEE